MKRANLRIIGIEEGVELQLKGTENIFNKITEENVPNLKKNMPMKEQEAYRKQQIDWTKKKMFPCHIIIKTLNIQNKKRILRTTKEKGQVTHKSRLIRITTNSTMETMKARRSWSDMLEILRDHR